MHLKMIGFEPEEKEFQIIWYFQNKRSRFLWSSVIVVHEYVYYT